MGGMALAAVDRRHLRAAVVHGHAPHARDRHPRGAWRHEPAGADDRLPAARVRILPSAACSAARSGSLFLQLRAMILIGIPDARLLDAGDDLPDAGDRRRRRVLVAGSSRARHSTVRSAQRRLAGLIDESNHLHGRTSPWSSADRQAADPLDDDHPRPRHRHLPGDDGIHVQG